jgi:hypothetical protein
MSRVKVRSSPVRLWWVSAIAAAIVAFAPIPEWAIETFFSRGAFPLIQRAVTFITNIVPFAVLDVLIVLGVVLVLFRIIQLARVAFSDDVVDAAWEGVKRLLRMAAVVVLAFLLLWGLNYRRVPLAAIVGDVPPPSVALLQSVIADSNVLATSLRGRLSAPTETNLTYEVLAERMRRPMDEALTTLGRPTLSTPGRPKYSLILTPFFRWAGVNGMVNPLALESVVDPGLLPVERPFVLAHEWAHLAGLADEAEASAVGWLACMKGSPAMAYSASLYLIAEAVSGLPPAAQRAALAGLEEGVKEDLTQIANRALRQQKPGVQRAANRVYDEYLRANKVDDGAASYGRAVRLILSPMLRGALNDYRGSGR